MPKHIKYFEWTWLGSLSLGIIVAALSYSEIVGAWMEIFSGFIQFFTFVIMLLLILLTSRKRNNIAKWILVTLFGLGIIFYIPQLSGLFDVGFAEVLSSLQVLTQCVGIYFLFTQESRDWFRVIRRNLNEIPP